MPPIPEPTLTALPNPLLRYLAATRPAFLSVTFVGVLLGLAVASHGQIGIEPLSATLTLLFALFAHAGANVVNDYYDAQSGCDEINDERVFPFTGGSRFIQNKVISLSAIGVFGHGLLLSVIPAGLWLTAHSALGLIWIGLAGLIIGWAYSAPPCKLQSRGLGEFGITIGWLLVVIGSDFVQRRSFDFAPIAAGLAFALLVANVLYINQFPDFKADRTAGKRTLVVRLGTAHARWGYSLIAVLGYGWLVLMTITGHLPTLALVSLFPVLATIRAATIVHSHASQPQKLEPAIKLTILAAVTHGLLLAAALIFYLPSALGHN